MVALGDVNVIFYAGRVLGCSSYVVVKDNIKVTKRSIIWAIMGWIVYAITSIPTLYEYATSKNVESKYLMLMTTRVCLSYACLLTTLMLTTLRNREMRYLFSHLRNFDRATRSCELKNGGKIRAACCIILFLYLIFWSIVGYVSYRSDPVMAVLSGASYAVINIAISVQILIFASVSLLLCERFYRLCRMLTLFENKPISMGNLFNTRKIIVLGQLNGHLKLQEIWWLHCCLANATVIMNSVYAIQLLLWIACMSLNTLSRIYTLNENSHLSIFHKIRESMLVIACVGHLLLITAICHVTSHQANRVGEIIFSSLTRTYQKGTFMQENIEALTYFQHRKVHFFTIVGFVRIDLSLLLSIASAITTYLVILHAANIDE